MEKTDVSSSSPESESDRNVRMVTEECSKSRMFEKIKPIGPIVLTRSHFGPHEAIGPHGKTTCRDQIRQEAHDEQGLNLCVELNSNKERLKSVIVAKENGSERRSGGDSHASKTVQPKSHSINSRRSSTRAWSNERIPSCYHRVNMEGEEVRYALGMFAFLNGMIQTPEELIDDEHPLQYKPFDHQGLLQFYQSSTDPGKGDRNIMKVYCGV
ncbi:hypothetical protein LWI28_014086 [Acer negundo]|uniref:Uncharacterized protein n=1 Tax=Acer negundo TaxID=4023 RepID=A0AAD5IES6_ACENE|nr:hypothetical protein LWI28_014086 [Acer negundo]